MNPTPGPDAAADPPRERLGILGTGAVALGLARVAAGACDLVVWARSDKSAQRAAEGLEDVRVETDLAALSDRTLVVEAVVEDREVKSRLLARLHDGLDPAAVIATTTSALSVTTLARASGRPERFAGLHFFNPVERMELVELAFPPEAGPETRARARALAESLGKTCVEVPDEAGFVVNRLLFPYLFDAVRVMDRTGLDAESVDACMRLGAGHPMGPLALLDFVGLDVAAAIGEAIGAEVPARVRELVSEGRLGRKTGAGFHAYEP